MIVTEAGLTDQKRKTQLGQYFTSVNVAQYMADLFAPRPGENCLLLDAGAGLGYLSEAFLEKWVSGGFNFTSLRVDAFEIDSLLSSYLSLSLGKYNSYPGFSVNVRNADFIYAATEWLSGSLFAEELPKYTHAILNPPYKKIQSDSGYRAALRRAGIETVNLYTAFIALSLSLLEERGQLVAIIPRSFCNGPYYRHFREYVLQRAALHHLHLFESRTTAFKDDDVLQENVIILLERSGQQGPVTISTSIDDSFSDLVTRVYPFAQIVFPEDPEHFIHVPTSPEKNVIESSSSIRYSLADIGVQVSTGPVVDFRIKEHLRELPDDDSVPLLFPIHFRGGRLTWPILGSKKPNAIAYNEDTRKWLYPNGYYCVVRRFSSKEEKRRVVSGIVDPTVFQDVPLLGFENHLNVIHKDKHGLPEMLARGLAVYLNTSALDNYFRRFNGHTQVNATDLRLIKYPNRDLLSELGKWAKRQKKFTQAIIDAKFESLIL
jgi:adenine-specific DNA-methyltransferase